MIGIDAQKSSLVDALFQVRHGGRSGQAWTAGYIAYGAAAKAQNGVGMYLLEARAPDTRSPTLLGLKIVIDPTMAKDAIEFRDEDDRIVGKIYNIR